MLGRLGWYVTTTGTLLIAFLGRGANVSSLVFNLALLICFKTNAFFISPGYKKPAQISSPEKTNRAQNIFFEVSKPWHMVCFPYTSGDIYSRSFENIPQKGPEYSHRNLTIARCLVNALRKNIGGLLSQQVSLSSSVPEQTGPQVGKKGPPCQSLAGEGAAKAWYCPLILFWQSQCTPHVCRKFVMSNSFNV